MKKIWLAGVGVCLAGCSSAPAPVGIYKEGFDVAGSPVTVTQGIIAIDLRSDGTFRMTDGSSPHGPVSGPYTIRGNRIWLVMPNGTRRQGHFQGKELVPNWKDFGLGNPTIKVGGRLLTATGHRFVKQ